MKKFPENFLWGAAASAPQTEGNSLEYGKSASTWDFWYKEHPEIFYKFQGPDSGLNMYQTYKEDCHLMQKNEFNSFRTSISWTRLLPDGETINLEAVDFYRSYFKEMLDNNIQPIINLFHFDMPMWLMEIGGWENKKSIDYFAYYAKTAFELFGDIIKKWVTFNEPLVHIECGYLYGYHYPAVVDFKRAIQVGYHTLLAHSTAVKVFREHNYSGQIGLILNLSPCYAKSDRQEDQEAKEIAELFQIKSFLDPAVFGSVSSNLVSLLKKHDLSPEIDDKKEFLKLIKYAKIDFLGVNYYQPRRVHAPDIEEASILMPESFYQTYLDTKRNINESRGWEIYPEGIYDIAMMIKNEYLNIPWYISENGIGVTNEVETRLKDFKIEDNYRIIFMEEHLKYLHLSIQEGSNCFGYHLWTFIDCWSWLNGYKNRYGLYGMSLDSSTQRISKSSSEWFKRTIQKNGF